jgi:hypothetical protein
MIILISLKKQRRAVLLGNVPLDAPGLGIELNEEALLSRMDKSAKLFELTQE